MNFSFQNILKKAKHGTPSHGQPGTQSRAAVYLWLLLLVLLVMYAWTMKQAVAVVLKAHTDEVGARPAQSVRIDFAGYDKVIERLQPKGLFTPEVKETNNPFRPAVAPKE